MGGQSTVEFIMSVEVGSFLIAGDVSVVLFWIRRIFNDLAQVIVRLSSFELLEYLLEFRVVELFDIITLLIRAIPLVFVLSRLLKLRVVIFSLLYFIQDCLVVLVIFFISFLKKFIDYSFGCDFV